MPFSCRPLLVALAAFTAFSASAEPDARAIEAALTPLGLSAASVTPSPIQGMNEVVTERGIIYMSDDGQYFMAGNLYHSVNGEPVNLTEQKMATINKGKLKGMEDEMIVYPAKDEKYVVTVFTDTSCGYCRKLHSEMQAYNDAGITIRYLAFPRGGERSQNFGEMSAIWAAKDPLKAMDAAKKGTLDIDNSPHNDALVMKHYQLGVAMGVTGTPALVLEDGTMLPGYQPASRLLQFLNSRS
ncbi:bifunctional protein-disulfide isomerase/oxidoreductase DsbC [Photobacterium sp. 1_MG-2023]|uniref:bifunctional protein-disulfide isomerase/oxidoreductase DsbC n=1 Tax=Photobacterium sp. 1_MG-2023 TaxID=3062646 RepID=UPI0026E43159|nr:bifunctional protein-disulfide isomerase/oxidoreductase DsbC [Photobacterium sp. 1_MG-2023]MDO6704797.1 bifunctional protein-disulfide isomerase/oxidoreductase DsbC [Photobacterium sp. 1_MG-2023]